MAGPGSAELAGVPGWAEESLLQAKPEAISLLAQDSLGYKQAVYLRSLLQVPPTSHSGLSLALLRHAIPAPPSGKKADLPVPPPPTHYIAGNISVICQGRLKGRFKWLPSHPPQRPMGLCMSTSPASVLRAEPGEHTARKSPSASLVLPILLGAESSQHNRRPGPGIVPNKVGSQQNCYSS